MNTRGRKKGYTMSDEHKRKIGDAHIGMKRPPETGRKIALSKIGKSRDKETKIKISKSLKGNPAWNKGVPMREETKKKLSISHTGSKSFLWIDGRSSAPGYKSHASRIRRARVAMSGGSHTLQEWESLKKRYNYMCLCCKQCEPLIKLTEDHIVPIALGGSNDIENIQPLCGLCNSRKLTKIFDFRNERSLAQNYTL